MNTIQTQCDCFYKWHYSFAKSDWQCEEHDVEPSPSRERVRKKGYRLRLTTSWLRLQAGGYEP